MLRGKRVACLAMHAGAAGVAPGEEITWNYGPLYAARHGAYAAGAGCAPVPAPLCELPATYFGRPSLVPRDAYMLGFTRV